MGEVVNNQTKPEIINNAPIPVKLATLKGGRDIEASLTRGDVVGEGESGFVREAWVSISHNGKERRYPVVIKTFREQDEEINQGKFTSEFTSKRNSAYDAQLILYEALRRQGANVISTFRLAIVQDGAVLGIVMTNLAIASLDLESKVSSVDTTKTSTLGSSLTTFSRRKDMALARKIGLRLDKDSWMLQYSSGWLGLGRFIPRPVLSDLIGIKIEDPSLFNGFLKKAGNEDLRDKVNNNLPMKISLI